MKNISFAATIPQIIAQTKDVTRRIAWNNVRPGDRLRGVKKSMGLKRGERIEVIAEIEVVSVRREPLNRVTRQEVTREGFPNMTVSQFIDFFCRAMKCTPSAVLTRIEFRYV